jgi:hypothetical protein
MTKLTRDRSTNADPDLAGLKEPIKSVGLSTPIRVEQTADGFALTQAYQGAGAKAVASLAAAKDMAPDRGKGCDQRPCAQQQKDHRQNRTQRPGHPPVRCVLHPHPVP